MGSTGSFNGMEESSWEEPGLFQGHSGWDVLEEGSGTSKGGIWAITCSDHRGGLWPELVPIPGNK